MDDLITAIAYLLAIFCLPLSIIFGKRYYDLKKDKEYQDNYKQNLTYDLYKAKEQSENRLKVINNLTRETKEKDEKISRLENQLLNAHHIISKQNDEIKTLKAQPAIATQPTKVHIAPLIEQKKAKRQG